MFKREAPLRVVPTPKVDDGSGHHRRSKCALCGDQIKSDTCSMVVLMKDPEQLVRTAHLTCGREYSLYRLAMGE